VAQGPANSAMMGMAGLKGAGPASTTGRQLPDSRVLQDVTGRRLLYLL
jgi:hypothetical protein